MNNLLNEAIERDPAFCPNNCGRSYKGTERKSNLKKHLIYACGVNPRFECSICCKKFVYKHTLKVHLYSIHKQL